MLKLMHLLKVTGKIFDLLKSKSYLSRLGDVAHQSTHYLSLPWLCQKLLSSYVPTNFSLELKK